MTRLYLVRNGRTEEGTGFEHNPGLDDVGREQAEAVAGLLGSLPRLKILSSPQRRALETAVPLARQWCTQPILDESVTLMPMPDAEGCDRKAWLLDFLRSTWSAAPPMQARWREACISRLCCAREDLAIFSHFLVINAIVGAALMDDRVTVFQPDNGSITIMETADGMLTLLERGREASTRLL